MTWTRGRRLGIDAGRVRVGVALCDPDGILATPVETVPRDLEGAAERSAGGTGIGADVRRIAELVAEHDVVGVVLGLPRTLRGEDGPAARAAREFADALRAGLDGAGLDGVPVELADERMTTVVAARQLSGRGVKGRRQRSVVDQAAAVQILQGWLDAVRADDR